jgi:hypothetical protein
MSNIIFELDGAKLNEKVIQLSLFRMMRDFLSYFARTFTFTPKKATRQQLKSFLLI